MDLDDKTLSIDDKTIIKIPIVSQNYATDSNFALTQEELSIIKKLSKKNALLIQSINGDVRPRYLIDTPKIFIGRDVSCDIQLEDHSVSRKHAKIEYNEDEKCFLVEDMGSLNGIYHNNTVKNSFKLANGDLFQIGKFKLYFFQNV